MNEFLHEVVLHGITDTLKLIPFLFLTYLFMEFIEHKGTKRIEEIIKKTGPLATPIGALLGAVPQCGFSAASANLYAGRVISIGTLVAVFLSTSDEMLPILLSNGGNIWAILSIILYKIVVGMLVGLAFDFILRLAKKDKEDIDIDRMCESDGCGCEKGILPSALHHTLSIGLFVLIFTFILNTVIFLIGEDTLGAILGNIPVLTHIVAALVGLIPNCAASVVLSELYSAGIISVGVMLAGLLSGAGTGLIVLLRVNRSIKENAVIIGALVLSGVVFGLIADLTPLSMLFKL